MELFELETSHLRYLEGQFANGSCVLFVGAGFSLDCVNLHGEPFPNALGLRNAIQQICWPGDPVDEDDQLQDVYEYAATHHPKELSQLLKDTFTVDVDRCPEWYRDILTMPWRRIYTLNIDNLITRVLETNRISRRVQVVSATTSSSPLFNDSALSVVHLNGTLDDLPDKVTFSRSQYARRSTTDPAYAQLATDLKLRPVVFIGSKLEEGPLWQHIELRGRERRRREQELRPKSFLVIPDLPRSKSALLTRHNVVWLPMTGAGFTQDVIGKLSESRQHGADYLATISSITSDSKEEFNLVTDLVEMDVPTGEYLFGATPSWCDVTDERVAPRECFEELWQRIRAIRTGANPRQFIIVTGTAGSGKSSALMHTAMRLEAEGVDVAWLDSSSIFSPYEFRRALQGRSQFGAILVNDADLYDARLSILVRDALEQHPRLIIVCECRSNKVERIIRHHELEGITPIEFAIPNLVDSDIDAILTVLDREHRLGALKGEDRDSRRKIFQNQAGRQLLVAMHFATSGKEFQEKAQDEMREMAGLHKFIYGLICVASAYRFDLLQDDIGIACIDSGTSWLQALNDLYRRKLVIKRGRGRYSSRHRIIAQFVLDSLSNDGGLYEIINSILRIGATKSSPLSGHHEQPARLLRTFINHNFLKRTGIGTEGARALYAEYEDALSWNHHYWLHRGALELEAGQLDYARNYLQQAKGINDKDVFIDNELAYLALMQAIRSPKDQDSPKLVEEAMASLDYIADTRRDQLPHAYHILGSRGLEWSQVGIEGINEKKEFLERLIRRVDRALDYASTEILKVLMEELKRELYSLAITDHPSKK